MTDTPLPQPRVQNRKGSSAAARVAGIAYLVTIAAGLFAEVYARGSIWVPNDPGRTMGNLGRLDSLYRWGILSDYVMLVAYAAVTALLYRLFKPTNASLS